MFKKLAVLLLAALVITRFGMPIFAADALPTIDIIAIDDILAVEATAVEATAIDGEAETTAPPATTVPPTTVAPTTSPGTVAVTFNMHGLPGVTGDVCPIEDLPYIFVFSVNGTPDHPLGARFPEAPVCPGYEFTGWVTILGVTTTPFTADTTVWVEVPGSIGVAPQGPAVWATWMAVPGETVPETTAPEATTVPETTAPEATTVPETTTAPSGCDNEDCDCEDCDCDDENNCGDEEETTGGGDDGGGSGTDRPLLPQTGAAINLALAGASTAFVTAGSTLLAKNKRK